jgi:alpha-amylase/alpha-mannosidase (GH57 family)
MSNKYICIHGHFYQPPRENAWVEEIEIQDSAAPYHDWNERITHECYGPNGVARILNEENKIVDIVSNYARMSFNFGPTLLSWLELKAPKTYQYIIAADQESMIHFSGHGSAMAQVYNHIIMPLANRRDKETQVKWGIHDFEQRFNRLPEGMWLAETAVDTETLEVLAENNIKFTVLAPYQAKKYRKQGESKWINGIDTKKAYRCNLPSGKYIHLFFYDGPHSQGIAFNGYLNNGKHFAESLISAFDDREDSQLVHVATDGESYGHHHENGEMALAYCMRRIEENDDIKLTNYSQFLELEGADHEVEINEETSWSCAHGIERWRSNCGCHTGGQEGWNQEWRVGLRNALDDLRDRLAELFENEIGQLHHDPWQLRNAYSEIFFKRTEPSIKKFFADHFTTPQADNDIVKIIRLLEMQKQSLYMFTSCGWFFNDVSGLETTQILQYANRAIQLAEETCEIELEQGFKVQLAEAKSNIEEYGTARDSYERWVAPKRLSLTQVGMHYAVSALFDDDEKSITVLNYECQSELLERQKAGTLILVSGITHVRSKVTLSYKRFSFAVVYMGNHHLVGGTSNNIDDGWFEQVSNQLQENFDQANLAGIIDIIKENFTDKTFSFFQLFKDQQLKLLNFIIADKVESAVAAYESIYDSSYSLLNLMKTNKLSVPGLLENNLKIVFRYKLEEIFEGNGELVQIPRLKRYASEVAKWNADIKVERISYLAAKKITHLVDHYDEYSDKIGLLDNLLQTLELLSSIQVEPDIEELQEFVFRMLDSSLLPGKEKHKAMELAELIGLEIKSNP